MPGDGVSLPTTLAQMGAVAKTQAKGQQVAPQVTPFSGQKKDEEELRVQRVSESSAAEKNKIKRETDEKDKRKRRRLKRKSRRWKLGDEHLAEKEGDEISPSTENGSPENESEELGSLIDLRV